MIYQWWDRLMFLIANDRGGVGKSTIMSLVVGWHRKNGRNPKLFDSDAINQSFHSVFPEAQVVDTSQENAMDDVLRAMVDSELALIDNHAGGIEDPERGFLAWLEGMEWFEWARDKGVGLTLGVIVNDISGNNRNVGRIMEEIAQSVNWIVFRNFRGTKKRSAWENSEARQVALGLEAAGCAFGVEVPRIDSGLIQQMDALSKPLEGLELASYDWAGDARQRKVLREFYSQLDEISEVLTVPVLEKT
jgi:hypothetical protein